MSDTYPAPFEELAFDEDYGQYQVAVDHRGNSVTCCFLTDDKKTLALLVSDAIEFWKKRAEYFKAFREYAAVDLLEELNDTLDCGEGDFKPVTSAQVRKLLPAPFSVRFGFNDGDSDFYFEMAGGDDEQVLQDCVFSVYGTLEEGIESGEVESMA